MDERNVRSAKASRRRDRVAGLKVTAMALTIVAAPAACTLLAAPGALAVTAPTGVTAWRADHRHLPDPVLADQLTIHGFLTAASTAERRSLIAGYPGVVGALDGAPAAMRYTANRRAMITAGPPYQDQAGRFLLFDPRGRGRLAQVYGDLATANRIAVLVPGAGVRAANFWTGTGGERFRSPAVQAAGLYRRAARCDSGLAVIAWLGYTTPTGAGMVREDLARAGAIALDRFAAGLAAIRPQATIALLGHSYGSTVIGLAAPRLPRQVTDIAVFGSPGMGVHDVTGLRTAARVWAGLSARDWIRWVPGARILGLGHGTKPTESGFGARVFATADVTGHDHYLDPGTDSLDALAGIAACGSRS